jgi:hypothetical protein
VKEKYMNKIKISVSTLALLGSLQAYAGAESHGGQAVVCPGKETVMLDYYQATLPTMAGGAPTLVDVSQMSSDDILKLFNDRININPNKYQEGQLSVQYARALELVGPVNTWLEGSLQSVSDSDPAYTLPPGCSLQQVAIRQDTTMYVDPSIFALLSPAQQGILVAHEALYYVASQIGNQDSSVPVRMVVRSLLMKDEDVVDFSKAVHEMGVQLFWWEDMASQTYYSEDSNHPFTLNFKYDSLLDGDAFEFNMQMPMGPANTAFVVGKGTCNSQYNTCEISDPHSGLDCKIEINFVGSNPHDSFLLSCSDGNAGNFPSFSAKVWTNQFYPPTLGLPAE